jgi:hypothetical protein
VYDEIKSEGNYELFYRCRLNYINACPTESILGCAISAASVAKCHPTMNLASSQCKKFLDTQLSRARRY